MIFRKKEIEAQVESLAGVKLEALGVELVAVEYFKSHEGMVLRLYVDCPGGITTDELVNVHRTVESILNSKDETISDLEFRQYRLEISSPGINRILKKREDFERFKMRLAVIELNDFLNGERKQKNFTGILNGMRGDMILLKTEMEIIEIPMDKIKSAHLKVELK